MARIRFYPEDNNLHPSDHIIGTDEVTGGGSTRVFTVQALSDYLLPVISEAFDLDAIVDVLDRDPAQVGDSIINKTVDCVGDQLLRSNDPYEIHLFRTALGSATLEIHTGSRGLTHDFSSFASHAISWSAGGATVTSYDGYISSSITSGEAYVFTLALDSSTTLPIASDSSETVQADITIAEAGDSTIQCYTVGIAADTFITGDLSLDGDLIIDGQTVDIAALQIQVTDNTDSIEALENNLLEKADISALHPAATLPVPNPAVAGTATTAITGISIDPATQELVVTRGTVPVVIGDVDAGGGTNVTANNVALADLNIPTGGQSTLGVTFGINGTDLIGSVEIGAEIYDFTNDASNNVVFTVSGNTVMGNVDLSTYIDTTALTTALEDYITEDAADLKYAPIMHNHPLSGLEDVDITGLADGDILYWDNTASRWKPKTEGVTPGTDTNVDLLYIGETFDANDNIIEGNKIINVETYDLDGNPASSTDQFSIPLASETEFGLVRLSRFVQEAIQECETTTIPGYSSQEITYDVSSPTSVTETIDFGTGTSTMWVGEGQFAGQVFYVDAGDIPDSVSGVDGTITSSGRLAEGYLNAKYVDIAGIYVNPTGAAFPSSGDLELMRSAGDPVTGLGLNLAFMRTTGKTKTVEVVYSPLYSITEPFYELELVTFDYQPVTVSGSHEIISMLGTIDELIFNEDDEVVENCIEITAPLVINQLISGDNVINLGSGGGSLVLHYEKPTGSDTVSVIKGNTISEVVSGETKVYIYIGDDPATLAATTNLDTDVNYIEITGGGVTPPSPDAVLPFYIEQPPFDPSNPTTNIPITEGYIFQSNTNFGNDLYIYTGEDENVNNNTDPANDSSFVRIDGGGPGGNLSLRGSDTVQVLEPTNDVYDFRINATEPTPADGITQTSTLELTSTTSGSTTTQVLSWVENTVSTSKRVITFTSAMTNPLVVDHSLGQDFVQVQIYNNSMQMILPNEITLTDNDTVTIDFATGSTVGFAGNVVVVG